MIIASGFQGRKSRPAIFWRSSSRARFSPAKPGMTKGYNVFMTTQTSSSAQYRGDGRGNSRRSDVCIVGNGAIAKTAALGFSQAGHSVTLLVPPARPGAEETQGVSASGAWDVRVYALNHTAQKLLSSLKV